MNKLLIILLLVLFSAKLLSSDFHIDAEKFIISKSDGVLNIDSKLISVLENQKSLTINNFFINGSYLDIELSRAKSVINNKAIFVDGSGKVLKNPKVSTYQGNIKNKPESDILITIVNNMLFFSIKNNDRDIFIYPSNSQPGLYVVKNIVGNPLPLLNPNDVIEDVEQLAIIKEKTNRKLAADNKMLELELAVETDTEVFKATGATLEKAQAYTIALYDRVSKLYEQFINITITLSWVKTWTDSPADPYSAAGDPFILRDKALPYWDANYQTVPKDCYQAITSIGYGGGGFGYFNAMCNNNYYGMSSVSWQGWTDLSSNNFNYDIYITAHELGHNFNAQHSHSCFWDNAPLDTCVVTSENQDCLPVGQHPKPNPGSIMSYCGGINNSSGFGYYTRMIFEPQNIEIMRKYAEASDCITEYKGKLISITSPLGNTSFQALNSLTIQWYSTGIDRINIKYRVGKQSDWIGIAKNVETTIGQYTWNIPDICSRSLEIGLFDSSDETQFAIIDSPLTINNQSDNGLILYMPFDDDNITGLNDYTYCNFYDLSGNYLKDYDKFNQNKNSVVFESNSKLTSEGFDANFQKMSVSLWFNYSNGVDKHNLIGTNWENQPFFEAYIWNNMIGVAIYVKNNSVPKQIWHSYYLNPNQWYFMTFVADGKTMKLYLDGTLSQTVDLTSYDINSLANGKLYYGSRGDVEKYSGKLDEIHIYNRDLSDTEISNLFNMKKANTITNFYPKDGDVLTNKDYQLAWSPIDGASRYLLEITKQNGANKDYILDKNVNINQYAFTDSIFANFNWRVCAMVNDTKTEWSDYKSFSNSNVGVAELQNETNIECVPNPAITEMELKIDVPNQKIRNITIYNSLGKIVKPIFNGFMRDCYKEKIDVDFESGYYYITIQTDSNTFYKTLLIVK